MPQSSVVIPDSNGINLLNNLNNALATLLSLNSGDAEPTETAAHMLWTDTVNSVVKQRNATNDGWDILWTLSGGELATISAMTSALELKAPLVSPNFTENPKINGETIRAYPYCNRILNGAMQVNNIYGDSAVTLAASGYVADMQKLIISQASKITYQRVTDAPAGFKYSSKYTVAAQFSPAATDNFIVQFPIKGDNIIDFKLGLASAVTIVTSIYIKSSIAGTYAVSLRNAANNRSYVGEVTVTTGWTKVAIQLVGDTSGVWEINSSIGLLCSIDLGSGSNFNATQGVWSAGNFTRTAAAVSFVNQVVGTTINITGVKVEKIPDGATSGTDYDHREFLDEDDECQEYLPYFNVNGYTYPGQVATSTQAFITLPFRKKTRASITGISYTGALVFSASNGAANGTGISFYSGNDTQVLITGIGNSGLTAGNATMLQGSGKILCLGAQL